MAVGFGRSRRCWSASRRSAPSAAELYGPEAKDARRGGTLTVGSLVEPPGLDPFHQGADARIRVTVLMYQGLFYEAVDGEAAPLLAESYEVSPDKLVYTVKLRQGVKFHTGQPMTAKDVAYSYNYIRDPKNGSPGAGDYTVITAIDAIDDSTVKITLSQPNASLPMTLGNKYGAVIPAGYFDAPDSKTKLNQTSVGTGPFKLVEFKPNSNLTLARNPDYWEKGAPYLDQVNFVSIPNSASMLVGLTNKRVDLALLNRPQDVRQVEKVPGLKTRALAVPQPEGDRSRQRVHAAQRPARAPGDRARRRQGRGDARLDRRPRTSNRHDGRRDAGPLGAAPPRGAQPEAGRGEGEEAPRRGRPPERHRAEPHHYHRLRLDGSRQPSPSASSSPRSA